MGLPRGCVAGGPEGAAEAALRPASFPFLLLPFPPLLPAFCRGLPRLGAGGTRCQEAWHVLIVLLFLIIPYSLPVSKIRWRKWS